MFVMIILSECAFTALQTHNVLISYNSFKLKTGTVYDSFLLFSFTASFTNNKVQCFSFTSSTKVKRTEY